MQTLKPIDGRWLYWQQVDLANGVFRVQGAEWRTERPDLIGWVDWTGSAQLEEEISLALEMLGACMFGKWVGFGRTIDGICHGIAWMVS